VGLRIILDFLSGRLYIILSEGNESALSVQVNAGSILMILSTHPIRDEFLVCFDQVLQQTLTAKIRILPEKQYQQIFRLICHRQHRIREESKKPVSEKMLFRQ
jgi:hypothetical protein